jgi:hypothetical protein
MYALAGRLRAKRKRQRAAEDNAISEQQKQCVDSKNRTFLDPATLRDAA